VVSAAEMLQAISCDEMLELAAHGAKVLHAGCVEIARRTGIALYARATATMGGGTRIDLVGARADVDALRGLEAAGEIVPVHHPLLQGDGDAHLSRGRGPLRRLLAATAQDNACGQSGRHTQRRAAHRYLSRSVVESYVNG